MSIQDLPEEIRVGIYKRLPQLDLVHNVRLVCKQWRFEVDNLCELIVELDDRKIGWERILELRIKSCKIIHFVNEPPNGIGTTILKHKNLLKTLKISETISPANFFYILCDCSTNLTSLEVSLGMNLTGGTFTTPFSLLNFEKLKKFSIKVSTLPSSTRTGVHDGDNVVLQFLGSIQSKHIEDYFTQFLTNPMSNLKSLKIQIRCLSFAQVSKFTQLTLSFIASHWRQLKCFDFDLLLGHGLPSSEFRPLNDHDLSQIDLSALHKCVNLQSLRIVSSSPVGVNLWLDLLERQKNLLFLEVDVLPAPSCIFRDVVQDNCSLVYIEITDLTVWDEENVMPFDMTCFMKCVSLKKLILDRNVTRRRVYDTAELINLFNLPSSLEEVAFNYFLVNSDELIIFCNSSASQNLNTLYLTQCGCSGFFGVDGTVLEKIIEMPSISFIEITPLNFNSDPEETEKLNLILETFGYPSFHSYFQLSKMIHQIPIQFHAIVIGSNDDDDENNNTDRDEQ